MRALRVLAIVVAVLSLLGRAAATPVAAPGTTAAIVASKRAWHTIATPRATDAPHTDGDLPIALALAFSWKAPHAAVAYELEWRTDAAPGVCPARHIDLVARGPPHMSRHG